MFLLRTLGAFAVLRDGAPVDALAAHRRAMGILAILAAGGTVSRDRVMALLWPESDTDRARGSLKQALHLLRRHLDSPELLGGRADLTLDRGVVDTDVQLFRAALAAGNLAQAVDLYDGPFLDGVHLGGGSELEEWIDNTRGTLAREYGAALEGLATAAEAKGDFSRAVEWWRKRQVQDPWDSRVALALIQALVAAGQRSAALQHAQAHEILLRAELDLAPDPAVTTYVEALRREGGRAAPLPPLTEGPLTASPSIYEEVPRSRWLRGRVVVAAAALAVIATVAGFTAFGARQSPGDAEFDADLIAVAPFGVVDPSLALWREGLGDILAQDLDGAGPLRTVAPAVALRRGRVSDRASALQFGERTGSGIVLYGNVTRRGTDSVQIRATIVDRAHQASDQVEIVGAEARIGQLADSLGVGVLRILGERRPIASSRHVSIGARSLPALKSFLRGEQLYRLGEADSALRQFDLAVRADSTFALALRRMVWLLGNFSPSTQMYAPRLEYVRRAARMNHGLSLRDSTLLAVDSAYLLAAESTSGDELMGRLYRATASLEALLRRYPDDPAVWYDLAELRAHLPPPIAGYPEGALEAFDRAIALDSGFAPAYMHTIGLSVQLGDIGRARNYARQYAAAHSRNPANVAAPAIQLLAAIFRDDGVASPTVARQVDSASANTLYWIATDLLRWRADSAETAVMLLRALGRTGGPVGVDIPGDTLMQDQALALALAFRGHLAAAARQNAVLLATPGASLYSHRLDPFLDLALLGTIGVADGRRAFAPALAGGSWGNRNMTIPPRHLTGLPWWFAQRDSVSLRRMASRGLAIADSATEPVVALRGRYFGTAAGAYLTLLRGDSSGAVRRFTALPDSLCLVSGCVAEKIALARLHAALGNDRAAATLYQRWTRLGLAGPSAVMAALEHGRVAERIGDRATAATQYRFVADAWQRADVMLQGYVREARAGLQRVAGPRLKPRLGEPKR